MSELKQDKRTDQIKQIHTWIDNGWTIGMENLSLVEEEAMLALDLAESLDYSLGIGLAKRNLAYARQWKSHTQEAFTLITDAIDRFLQVGSQDDLGSAYDILGNIHMAWGSYDDALECFYASGEAYKKTTNTRGVGWSYMSLGGVYFAKKDYELSIEYSNKSIDLFRSIGFINGVNAVGQRLALILRNEGKLDEAMDMVKTMLSECESIMMDIERVLLYQILASIHRLQGDLDQALVNVKIAKGFVDNGSMLVEKGEVYEEYGRVLHAMGRYDQAETILLEGLAFVEANGFMPKVLNIELALADLYEEMGSIQKAFAHYRAYMEVKDQVDSQERSNRFRNVQLSHEMKLVEKEAEINRLRNVELRKANESISRLLNNSNQGFLTLDDHMQIEPHHSKECNRLLGPNLIGLPIDALLQLGDDRDMVRDIFQEITALIKGPSYDTFRVQAFLGLLPEEIQVNGIYLNIQYKVIQEVDQHKVMVILTDITERVHLEDQIKQEESTLRMLVEVLTNTNEFKRIMRDFRSYLTEELPSFDQLNEVEKFIAIESMYRIIHTFKGTFSTYAMARTTEKLHQLESEIAQLLDGGDNVDQKIATVLPKLEWDALVREDYDVIKGNVPPMFFDETENLLVTRDQVDRLIHRLKKVERLEDLAPILADIDLVRQTDFKDLLREYPDKVYTMAERYGKRIESFQVEGDEIAVLPEQYQAFTDSLIHVFRNAIDHGIETEDQRMDMDKPPAGRITVDLRLVGRGLELRVADDGAGIDLDRIRHKVVDQGIMSLADFDSLSRSEQLQLIMTDRVSTAQTLSELSGRGVGMAAVREAVKTLGGLMTIESEKGKGTVFTFRLPYMSSLSQ